MAPPQKLADDLAAAVKALRKAEAAEPFDADAWLTAQERLEAARAGFLVFRPPSTGKPETKKAFKHKPIEPDG